MFIEPGVEIVALRQECYVVQEKLLVGFYQRRMRIKSCHGQTWHSLRSAIRAGAIL